MAKLMPLFSSSDKPLMKRFAANTGYLVAQYVFQYILSAVVGILAARYMGPDNYGVLSYGASLMAMFLPFCTLGIDSIEIPALLDAPEKQGETVGTCFVLRLISSSLSILLLTAIAALTRPGNRLLIFVTFLQSLQFLFQACDAFRLWFQKELLSKYTAIGSIIGNVACSIWRIALLSRGATVEWFALTSVIQMLTNYLFVIPMFFTRSKLALSFSWAAGKALLSKGYHFILSGLTVAVTNYYGKLLLGYQLGDAPLGYFNAASTVALMWIFVPQAIVSSATPVLLADRKNAPDAFEPRYQAVHLVILLLGVLAGIGMSVLSPFLINLLYGEKFLPAAPLLSILAWTGLFSAIGEARGIWVLAENKLKYVKYYCGISALCSVLFNSVGVALFGMTGAAVATLLTGFVQALAAPLFFAETRAFTKQYFGSFLRIRELYPEILSLLKRRKHG